MSITKINKLATIGFFLAFFLSIFMIATNHEFKNNVKSIPPVVLLLSYIFTSRKWDKLVITLFVIFAVGEIMLISFGHFNFGVICFGFCNIILIRMILTKLKKIPVVRILKYFLMSLVLFSGIFIFVLEDKGDAYFPLMFYGVTICLAGAVYLLNYLQEMNHANYLLLLAIGLRILSDCIYSIVLFGETDIYFDVISLSTFFTSNYLFYRGFIQKEESIVDPK